jgi:hypothetical protein
VIKAYQSASGIAPIDLQRLPKGCQSFLEGSDYEYIHNQNLTNHPPKKITIITGSGEMPDPVIFA